MEIRGFGVVRRRILKELLIKKINSHLVLNGKIILDAKLHDYLKIEDCIEKYSPYCEKIVFICMKKKRTNWQLDFKHNKKVEFWYPDDILTWIPEKFHKIFLDEINNIENMWTEEQKDGSFLGLQEAIQLLNERGEMVTQDLVAELMGTGRYFFRDKPELKNIIMQHQVDKKVNDEHELVLILQEVLKEKVERGDVISYQGVAKTLLESLPPKETKHSPDQQLWTLTRKLIDNARCKAIMDTEIEKYQQKPELLIAIKFGILTVNCSIDEMSMNLRLMHISIRNYMPELKTSTELMFLIFYFLFFIPFFHSYFFY